MDKFKCESIFVSPENVVLENMQKIIQSLSSVRSSDIGLTFCHSRFILKSQNLHIGLIIRFCKPHRVPREMIMFVQIFTLHVSSVCEKMDDIQDDIIFQFTDGNSRDIMSGFIGNLVLTSNIFNVFKFTFHAY